MGESTNQLNKSSSYRLRLAMPKGHRNSVRFHCWITEIRMPKPSINIHQKIGTDDEMTPLLFIWNHCVFFLLSFLFLFFLFFLLLLLLLLWCCCCCCCCLCCCCSCCSCCFLGLRWRCHRCPHCPMSWLLTTQNTLDLHSYHLMLHQIIISKYIYIESYRIQPFRGHQKPAGHSSCFQRALLRWISCGPTLRWANIWAHIGPLFILSRVNVWCFLSLVDAQMRTMALEYLTTFGTFLGVNVGKYSIHGASGMVWNMLCFFSFRWVSFLIPFDGLIIFQVAQPPSRWYPLVNVYITMDHGKSACLLGISTINGHFQWLFVCLPEAKPCLKNVTVGTTFRSPMALSPYQHTRARTAETASGPLVVLGSWDHEVELLKGRKWVETIVEWCWM